MLLVNNVLTETACTYCVGGVSEPAEQVQQDSEAVAQDGDPPPGMCVCAYVWDIGGRERGRLEWLMSAVRARDFLSIIAGEGYSILILPELIRMYTDHVYIVGMCIHE